MTTRLELYNQALTICGEEHLSALTDDIKSRRLLDHVWLNNGVQACLEAGQWNFAIKTVQIDPDPDITIDYGYQYAYQNGGYALS